MENKINWNVYVTLDIYEVEMRDNRWGAGGGRNLLQLIYLRGGRKILSSLLGNSYGNS